MLYQVYIRDTCTTIIVTIILLLLLLISYIMIIMYIYICLFLFMLSGLFGSFEGHTQWLQPALIARPSRLLVVMTTRKSMQPLPRRRRRVLQHFFTKCKMQWAVENHEKIRETWVKNWENPSISAKQYMPYTLLYAVSHAGPGSEEFWNGRPSISDLSSVIVSDTFTHEVDRWHIPVIWQSQPWGFWGHSREDAQGKDSIPPAATCS